MISESIIPVAIAAEGKNNFTLLKLRNKRSKKTAENIMTAGFTV